MWILEHSVDDVMRLWPDTIRVFLDHRARCIGCPIARFHTVAEACDVQGIDAVAFAAALAHVAEAAR